MKCRETRQLISPYLDRQLSPAEAEAVKSHLAECPRCRQEYEETAEISVVLREMGRNILPAPAGLKDAVMQQIEEEAAGKQAVGRIHRFSPLWRKVAGAVAAVLLFALAAVGLNYNPDYRIADNTPAGNPPAVNSSEPGKSDSNAATQPASSENSNSPRSTPETADSEKDNATAATEPSNKENDKKYEVPVILLNTAPEIRTTMLQIQVNDSTQTLNQVFKITDSSIEMVQKVNDSGSTIVRITVPKSEADSLIAELTSLGRVIKREENTKEVSASYSETLEQLLSLSKQRNETPDEEEQERLDKQIKTLETQLLNWQKEAEKETIVLWIQE